MRLTFPVADLVIVVNHMIRKCSVSCIMYLKDGGIQFIRR
jgi:hypothetical protein